MRLIVAMGWLMVCCVAPALAGEPGLVAEPPAGVRSVKTERGYMIPYTAKVPGSDVEYTMVPVPGGEFVMGSPEDESGRREDEGPRVRVVVEPFWIGKYEVTWDEYDRFLALYEEVKKGAPVAIRHSFRRLRAETLSRRSLRKAPWPFSAKKVSSLTGS